MWEIECGKSSRNKQYEDVLTKTLAIMLDVFEQGEEEEEQQPQEDASKCVDPSSGAADPSAIPDKPGLTEEQQRERRERKRLCRAAQQRFRDRLYKMSAPSSASAAAASGPAAAASPQRAGEGRPGSLVRFFFLNHSADRL